MTGARYAMSYFLLSSSKTTPKRNINDILQAYLLATHYDPLWYKAWHTWALAHFDVIAYMESQAEAKVNDVAGNELALHVVQAVEGM